jgi:hypothetical protein
VVAQFTSLTQQMQKLFDDFPGVMSLLSTGSAHFDPVLRILQGSATAALIVVALIVPVLWFSIFQNWRFQIMEMRQGRSIAASRILCLLFQFLNISISFFQIRIQPIWN